MNESKSESYIARIVFVRVMFFDADTLYTIRGEVGRGGSCIVYDGFYRTNARDEKTVRIKECYPYTLNLCRNKDNSLICFPEQTEQFVKAKAQMYSDFRLCNTLFYAEEASDAIISTINIYEANNTVYSVSAWSRENALPNELQLRINKRNRCRGWFPECIPWGNEPDAEPTGERGRRGAYTGCVLR